jgi:uncharacterized membrane protein YciS (DUF1049 family)
MKKSINLSIVVLTLMLLSGCQEGKNSKPYLKNGYIGAGVNPNSAAFKSKENNLDRENKIKMAEIEANSKIEIAKIESMKALNVAKIDSEAKKDIAQKTATVTLETTKLDTQTKEHQSMITLYIAVGFLLALIIAVILWFRYKRQALELQTKLEEQRLKQELEIKDKELQEQRIQKVLDLAISGQLPQEMQQEVINSLTKPETKVIESS